MILENGWFWCFLRRVSKKRGHDVSHHGCPTESTGIPSLPSVGWLVCRLPELEWQRGGGEGGARKAVRDWGGGECALPGHWSHRSKALRTGRRASEVPA